MLPLLLNLSAGLLASTGALFGIGSTNGPSSMRVVGGILLAWIATLPIAAACAAATVRILGSIS